MSNAELATSYAALILADDGVEITVSGRPRGSRATCARGEPRTDDGKLTLSPVRQDPDSHQGRQPHRCRAHLGLAFRQGTGHRSYAGSRSGYRDGMTGSGETARLTWDFLQLQALEGKDVKDLLSNVGSGGGAATAPAAGGAAAGGAAAAEEVKEEKVEGKFCSGGVPGHCCAAAANNRCREGGVGR
ncbi:hypothetical protein BT67DRAFT_438224 [Trichocladium antarcticum]|uniref:Large ribosomal subunit protein P1 n=1 Tax=Trichocladium antarcticum TaxID=1450529 RepID=A0AAN6UUM8_9PEZI|nr:hypothetical protein BT67DRAFT_438224 [Trichocladium antarcticum]